MRLKRKAFEDEIRNKFARLTEGYCVPNMSGSELYDQMAAKIARERAKLQLKASDPPLDGMHVATFVIACHAVERLDTETLTAKWQMFDSACRAWRPAHQDATHDPACTEWWNAVVEWHQCEMSRARLIREKVGHDAMAVFLVDLSQQLHTLRDALRNAWDEKYPKLPSSWQDGAFCIHFVE